MRLFSEKNEDILVLSYNHFDPKLGTERAWHATLSTEIMVAKRVLCYLPLFLYFLVQL